MRKSLFGRRLLLYPLLLFAGACQSPPTSQADLASPPVAETGPVVLRLDRTRYSAGDRVVLTMRNTTDHSYAFNPCMRVLERVVMGDEWQRVAEGNRICTMEAWQLSPRGEHTASTTLPAVLPTGRYRLVVELTQEAEARPDSAHRPTTAAARFEVE